MIYTTIQGEMFDFISYKIYGAEKYMGILIRANPQYAHTMRFDAGVNLNVPTISTSAPISQTAWGTIYKVTT
jgi:phage tail protein X